jgi:superfamily I DNA/RNA helicase
MAPAAPNDLFFVGDTHQRIYGYPVVMQQCGVFVRGRSARLRINYRTTEEIRRWATALLTGASFDDLDGGEDDLHGYHSLLRGYRPVVKHFSKLDEECAFLVEEIRSLCDTAPAETICIVARGHEQLRSHYLPRLRAAGINYLFLDKDTPEYAGTGVRLATMHRVKGLEFAHVLLAGINAEYLPPAGIDPTDADLLQMERCLLHVAATRARETLTVTGWGTPCRLLTPFAPLS